LLRRIRLVMDSCTLSPAIGEVMARMMIGEKPRMDVSECDYSRFVEHEEGKSSEGMII
jgi:hypothetical protein